MAATVGLRHCADFTRNVIVNEFGGAEPTPFMLDALVGYMLEFDFLPNSMLTADGPFNPGSSSGGGTRRSNLQSAIRGIGQPILRELPRTRWQLPRPPGA